MLCDKCNKNEATIHYTEVINGDVFFPKLNLEEAKIKYHKKDYDKYNLDFYVIDKSKCNLDFDIIDNYKNIKEI